MGFFSNPIHSISSAVSHPSKLGGGLFHGGIFSTGGGFFGHGGFSSLIPKKHIKTEPVTKTPAYADNSNDEPNMFQNPVIWVALAGIAAFVVMKSKSGSR